MYGTSFLRQITCYIFISFLCIFFIIIIGIIILFSWGGGEKGAQNILRDLKNSNDQRADYKIFNICYCRLWHISRSECLCCFQHIDFVTAICFHPRVSNCYGENEESVWGEVRKGFFPFFFSNLPSMKHLDLLLREQHHETLLAFGDFSDLILVWNDVIFCFRMIGIS